MENLTITTNDTVDTSAVTTVYTNLIVSDSVATVTIAGDTGMALTLVDTKLTSLDASGLTLASSVNAFGGLAWTTGAITASSTITGSAVGTNAVDFSLAATASTFVTYVGGSGNDAIIGTNGLNNVVTLGDGTNSYTQTAAGNATVTGGTGVDTITIGTGANTVNLGGGTTANAITLDGKSAGLNVITTTSTGVDTFNLGGAATDIQTVAGLYTTLTGWTAGDVINVSVPIGTSAAVSTQTAMGSALVLGGAVNFANYLDAAAAGDGNAANTIISWFQLDGDTYVVQDTSAAATFQDGSDSVICLSGLVDLSNSTIAAGVITIV